MKGLENFTDIIAIAVGMVGAMAKSIKKKLPIQTIIIGMCVAGILSFSLIGVVELFYEELTPKLIILVSFVVGWVANEITEKIDLIFDDVYEYIEKRIKNMLK